MDAGRTLSFPFIRLLLPLALGALLGIGLMARTADGQTTGALVMPGVGVADVKLGATPEAVERTLGQPASKVSFADEKEQWENFRYDLSKELPFVLGFDELWTYKPVAGPSQVPIWKVYFKDRKVNFIVVSGYVFSRYGQAAIKNGIGLNASAEQVKKAFPGGAAYDDPGGSQNLSHENLGVTFVLGEGRVRVMQIYAPR
jgi:hypothetical protein